MAQILCIGDAMLDVIVKMQGQMYLGSDTISQISTHGGGAAANTATWLASSGHKVFMSVVLEMMQLVELLLMNLMPGTLNINLSF